MIQESRLNDEFKLFDRLCDEFESSIKSDDTIAISSFLEQVPEKSRDSLLSELVGIQRFYDLGANLDGDPETIGKYQVQEKIGFGSFGIVYRALDHEVDRDVAIKVPRLDRPIPVDHVSIAREARRLARLSHPGLAKFHYCSPHPELKFYMVSDYIDGCLLRDKLQYNPPDWHESVAIVSKLCDVLSYLHQHNTYHCDLKPSNIILTKQGPVVIDFGLATREESFQIQRNAVFGTPGYISPEQQQGRSSAAGDVFSLSVILYEMLTGTMPYERTLDSANRNEVPPLPHRVNSKIPTSISKVCHKAITLDKAARFKTASEFKKSLEICQQPWTSRRNFLVAGAAIGGALLTGFTAQHFGQSNSNLAGDSGSDSDVPVAAAADVKSRVKIKLFPKDSQAVFWPLSGEQPFQSGSETNYDPASDLPLELSPGPYLVVVYQDDERFIEVLRYVPRPEETPMGLYSHQRWSVDEEGVVTLVRVKIPELAFPTKLVHCETDALSFYCDDCETTLAEFKQIHGGVSMYTDKNFFAASENQPATFVTFDQAIFFAEQAGKRLVEEHEFVELLRFNGAKFPWGKDWPEEATDWVIEPVRSHQWDRVSVGSSEIFGLYSNAAEWAMGWGAEEKERYVKGLPNRIVRGASWTVLEGRPFPKNYQHDADFRSVQNEFDFNSKMLGFRCAKSVKPRISAADFEYIRQFSPEQD